MLKEEKIAKAIEEWKATLFEKYGENHIFNITLYGSQNYNIDTENSDVDVKAIYVPSLKEAVFDKRISEELHNRRNEHCEVKDIREMWKMYAKQNINFLETLYTEYRWDNPKYTYYHGYLKNIRENIVNLNPDAAIKSTSYQAKNSLKQFKNNPSDYKKLAKAIYFYLFLNKFTNPEKYFTYGYCLKISDSEKFLDFPARQLLIDLKNGKNYLKNIDDCVGALDVVFNCYIESPVSPLNRTDINNFEIESQEFIFSIIQMYEQIDRQVIY